MLERVTKFVKGNIQHIITFAALAVFLKMAFSGYNPDFCLKLSAGVLVFWFGYTAFNFKVNGSGAGKEVEPPKATSGQVVSTATVVKDTAVSAVEEKPWKDPWAASGGNPQPKPFIPKPGEVLIVAGDTMFELPNDAPATFSRDTVNAKLMEDARSHMGIKDVAGVTNEALYSEARAALCGDHAEIKFSTKQALRDAMAYLFDLVSNAFFAIHNMTYDEFINPAVKCTDCGCSHASCECKPANSVAKQSILEEYQSIKQILTDLG